MFIISSFESLTGDELEDYFKDLITRGMGFSDYYPSSGQINLHDLDETIPSGNHLEIDGVLLLNKTAVIIESTSEQRNIKDKIRKFIRNIHLFMSSGKSLREKFSCFDSIPEEKLVDFEEIDNWKYVFFGTSKEIVNKGIKPADFPEQAYIKNNLTIFGVDKIEYFSQLKDLIYKFSKYEFLSHIGIDSSDFESPGEIQEYDFIKANNCYVTENNDVRAQVYLIKLPINLLLKYSRVSRYEGIPFSLENDVKDKYQRFLIKNKLTSIAKNFINNERRKTFPNTVTIVLSNDCEERNNKIYIPKKFGSLDIIDGQHRIFAYAQELVSESVRNQAHILASAIKFDTEDSNEISKKSAKIFCEINSNQAKVKNNLIYLIKYDVLGEKTTDAIAGKVILECNRERGALQDIFLTNSSVLKKRNKFNLIPVPIVTIVDNDILPLVKGEGIDEELDNEGFEDDFDHTKEYLKSHPDIWWKKTKILIQKYFSAIQRKFPHDWCNNSTSYLLSAKYISAFIRLLRYKLIDEELTIEQIIEQLDTLKTAIDLITLPGTNNPSLPRNHDDIPNLKYGIGNIFEFLKDPEHWSA